MDSNKKPLSFYNREFAKRFSSYTDKYTGQRITTAQGYLFALKSQEAGHAVESIGFLSVDELNKAFSEFNAGVKTSNGLPIRSMDDYLREIDFLHSHNAEEEDQNTGEVEPKVKTEGEVQGGSDEAEGEDPLVLLNSLIGLQGIKQEVNSLVAFVRMTKKREEMGLKTLPVSLHMVFAGNPGTGKTTVARLLAKVYKNLGLLSKGHLVEVDRSGLVSGYVGQTAIKTRSVIESAMGGILFIDEAYTLAKGDRDYGQEAIDTILKAMEDHREDFGVIVAGYPEQMQKFIESNPGLKSRFGKTLYFADYSAEELTAVFQEFCKQYDYKLSDEAEKFVSRYMESLVKEKKENFANARDVRNIIEQALRNHATRVMDIENPTEEQLKTIEIDDLNIWGTLKALIDVENM